MELAHAVTLALLLFVYVLNQCDRSVPSYIKSQLQEDLSFGDPAYGVLYGPAFSVVFVLAGVPLGRLVDAMPHRRVLILTTGLTVWSASTLFSGMARSYGLLLVLRVFLGLGESVGNPCCLGVISDTFGAGTPEGSLAASVYQMGVYLGSGLAAALGGGLGGGSFGWRNTLVLIGAVGVALAAAVFFAVPEAHRRPARRGRSSAGEPLLDSGTGKGSVALVATEPLLTAGPGAGAGVATVQDGDGFETGGATPELAASPGVAPGLADVAKYLFSLDGAWRLTIAGAVRTAGGVVLNAFMPGLLKDLFPGRALSVNFYYGAVVMVGGALSAFLGGVITRFLLRRGHGRAGSLVPAVSAALSCPFVLLIAVLGACGRSAGPLGAYPPPAEHEARCFAGSILSLLALILVGEVWTGPTVAIVVSVLPAKIKGLGLAIYFAILTLVSSLGPAVAGVVLAKVDPWQHRYAVAGFVAAMYLLSAACFAWSSPFIESDILRRKACEQSGISEINLSRSRKIVVSIAATALFSAAITVIVLALA